LNTEVISEQRGSLSRRSFIAGAGVVAAAGIAYHVPTQAYATETLTGAAAVADEPDEVKVFDGVPLAIGRVVHDPAICSGCRTCEIICAVYNEGIASSALSRMQWDKKLMDATITDIMTCKQCAGPECVAVCPTKALHVDAATGARVIDKELCVGCRLCLNACPVEPKRIRYNAAENICFKCNLCDGDPQCVKYCPTGALSASWIEQEDGSDTSELYEINLSGDSTPFTHIETAMLVLTETATGLTLDGVLWTSHATQFNIILAVFDVTADFYDISGNLIGSSDDSGHIEIPEMSSGEFHLSFTTPTKIDGLGKIAINVVGNNVTNAPGQEA
jgi:Fe-S-cluster-containing dehydrogenase component